MLKLAMMNKKASKLTAGILAGAIADRTKTIVQKSTGMLTSALSLSAVMSATKACMRPDLYSGLTLTRSTASGAKSQAKTVLEGLSSSKGKAVFPTPHPTWHHCYQLKFAYNQIQSVCIAEYRVCLMHASEKQQVCHIRHGTYLEHNAARSSQVWKFPGQVVSVLEEVCLVLLVKGIPVLGCVDLKPFCNISTMSCRTILYASSNVY